MDRPTNPLPDGRVLPPIPKSSEDKAFASEYLEQGLLDGIYEEVSKEFALEQVSLGRLISSAFVVWQGEGKDRKERFVVNWLVQRKHWWKGSIKMETLPSFAL